MSKSERVELTQEWIDKYKDKMIGQPTGKKRFRVKGKKTVRFAKAIGETRPEYIKPGKNEEGKTDFSNIIGHPAMPAMWVPM